MQKRYRKFMVSLSCALNGIVQAVKYETHMRYHLIMAGFALLAGFCFRINEAEWLYLLITITLVIFAELMNTALEANVDLVTKEQIPEARLIKDVAAGAVLVTSINAILTGLIIFGSKLWPFLAR